MVIIFVFILLSINLHSEQWGEVKLIDSLNSQKDDYSPNFNENLNKFYFASNRSGKSYIYHCNLADYSEKEILKGGINLTSKNSNYISFVNKNRAVFSSFRMGKRQAYQNLFYSNYQKQSWTKGTLIEELSGEYFISHPTVSPDGNTMIFSSNKDSEYGDSDLYICYRSTDGTWEKPISLDEINSPGYEITPFFASLDTLYFASDGQGGEGGFDIFVSTKELGFWQRPKPVSGLNSSSNDSDPCRIDNTMIFASDRSGGLGGLDLYEAKKIEIIGTNDSKQIQTNEIPDFSLSSENIQLEILEEYNRLIKYNQEGNIELHDVTNESELLIYPKSISINLSEKVKNPLLLKVSSNGLILKESLFNDSYNIDLTLLATNLRDSDKIEFFISTPNESKKEIIIIQRSKNKKISVEEVDSQKSEIILIDDEIIRDKKFNEIFDIVEDQMNSGLYKDYKLLISNYSNIINEDEDQISRIFNGRFEISTDQIQSKIILFKAY